MDEVKRGPRKKHEVPIWERTLISVYEAADLTGIGTTRLRHIAATPRTDLVVWVGSRMMFKRKKLEEYLEKSVSV